LCLNWGSEVFAVDASGVRLVERRVASAEEDAALTQAAKLTVKGLAKRGLKAKIVSQPLNRRTIDLIPEPAWADPPKAMIGELLAPEAAKATVVSVGAEPTGVPGGVVYIGGGPPTFLGLLEDQVERRQHGEVPRPEPEPGWTLAVKEFDPHLERVHESQLALG